MNAEKWQEIKQRVLQSFSDAQQYQEDLDPGTAEVLEFNSPIGKLQVRYITRPRVLDKKTSFSKRAGSDVKVDYVYSEDEMVNHLEIKQYNQDTDNWQNIDASQLGL